MATTVVRKGKLASRLRFLVSRAKRFATALFQLPLSHCAAVQLAAQAQASVSHPTVPTPAHLGAIGCGMRHPARERRPRESPPRLAAAKSSGSRSDRCGVVGGPSTASGASARLAPVGIAIHVWASSQLGDGVRQELSGRARRRETMVRVRGREEGRGCLPPPSGHHRLPKNAPSDSRLTNRRSRRSQAACNLVQGCTADLRPGVPSAPLPGSHPGRSQSASGGVLGRSSGGHQHPYLVSH